MSTYQPNIPTGTVDLDIDYTNIQGNFNQLNVQFGVDHIPLNNTTGTFPSGVNGIHTSIHFNPMSTTTTNPPNNYPPVVPTATPGFGQLFSVQEDDGINPDQALYFLTGGGSLTALTRNFQPAVGTNGSFPNNGYTFLPGGFILQWGVVASTTAAVVPVVFATSGNINFPLKIFNVQLTANRTSSVPTSVDITVSNKAKTGFNINNQASATGLAYEWWAIGN